TRSLEPLNDPAVIIGPKLRPNGVLQAESALKITRFAHAVRHAPSPPGPILHDAGGSLLFDALRAGRDVHVAAAQKIDQRDPECAGGLDRERRGPGDGADDRD